jgi:hypothetical protein
MGCKARTRCPAPRRLVVPPVPGGVATVATTVGGVGAASKVAGGADGRLPYRPTAIGAKRTWAEVAGSENAGPYFSPKMGVLTRRAQWELVPGLGPPVIARAVFAVPDPEVFRAWVSLAAGAAAVGGLSSVTAEAVDGLVSFVTGGPPRPTGWPRHILVAVTSETATLYACSAHRTTDAQMACLRAGEFKAHASWYPFNVDLSIIPVASERFVLSGTRGPRHGAAPTVRAVVSLASGADLDLRGRR